MLYLHESYHPEDNSKWMKLPIPPRQKIVVEKYINADFDVKRHALMKVQDLFDIEAVEMTTAELMGVIREKAIFPKEHQGRLLRVLEQADLVKFAKFQPDETNSNRLVNFAIKWLKETERLQKNA